MKRILTLAMALILLPVEAGANTLSFEEIASFDELVILPKAVMAIPPSYAQAHQQSQQMVVYRNENLPASVSVSQANINSMTANSNSINPDSIPEQANVIKNKRGKDLTSGAYSPKKVVLISSNHKEEVANFDFLTTKTVVSSHRLLPSNNMVAWRKSEFANYATDASQAPRVQTVASTNDSLLAPPTQAQKDAISQQRLVINPPATPASPAPITAGLDDIITSPEAQAQIQAERAPMKVSPNPRATQQQNNTSASNNQKVNNNNNKTTQASSSKSDTDRALQALDRRDEQAARNLLAKRPDFVAPDSVNLSKKEREAVNLAKKYAQETGSPIIANGKILYPHGEGVPTIIATPMQICDVELQAGEEINEIIVGDASRWMLETGTMGHVSTGTTTHVFIKPVDAGLETNAIITTNRRVYHLRLVSRRSEYTPYVGFLYPEIVKKEKARKEAEEARARHWNTMQADSGKNIDLTSLNFDYKIEGKADWKPEKVYNDGLQTFIRLPENKRTDVPVLLVKQGKDKNMLVNYRVKGRTMIINGVFDNIILILGVGNKQEKVTITRKI